MLLVGLTGGIASGKSTVSAMLSERGASVIDADQIAREVVMPGTTAWFKIRRHFGDDILFDDGFIDRQALGDIVFSDPRKLAMLNEITHPAIFRQVADRLERLRLSDQVVVLDAALLFESGLVDGVDLVVVVHSPREIQIERLAGKGMSERQASGRIGAQADPEVRNKGADVVIDNDGTLEDLTRRVDELWDDLQRRLRMKAAGSSGGPAQF